MLKSLGLIPAPRKKFPLTNFLSYKNTLKHKVWHTYPNIKTSQATITPKIAGTLPTVF
jgi:hypothetical protein